MTTQWMHRVTEIMKTVDDVENLHSLDETLLDPIKDQLVDLLIDMEESLPQEADYPEDIE